MIGYLKGEITGVSKNKMLIVNNGIGFEVAVKENTLTKFREITGETELYIYTHFLSQEFKMELYGFETQEEKELFATLVSLPKIGPKVALSILSLYSLNDITEIVYGKQIDRLSSVPGIGKKTAERIILELKDKIKNVEEIKTVTDKRFEDLISALSSLGFSPQESRKTAELTWKKNSKGNLEELIKTALEISRQKR